jgi:hypothetical protein
MFFWRDDKHLTMNLHFFETSKEIEFKSDLLWGEQKVCGPTECQVNGKRDLETFFYSKFKKNIKYGLILFYS